MNIGNALLDQDIALFTRGETEEALIVMRYFLHKEKSTTCRRSYVNFIGRLEKRLLGFGAPAQQQGPAPFPTE
jgi:hypothetical protein